MSNIVVKLAFGKEWMEYQKVEWIDVRKVTRTSKGQRLWGRCLDDIRGIVRVAIADASLNINWQIHHCFCDISFEVLGNSKTYVHM